MKKIFFVFGLLISLFASSQGDRMRPIYRFEGLEIADWYFPPTNYVLVNQRYRWVAGMFDSTLTVPTGATASLRTGGWTGAGALFVDSVNHILKFYSGSAWRDVGGVGDSDVLVTTLDSTGQPNTRILWARDLKIRSSPKLLFDSTNSKVVINHQNISVGGPNTKLWVTGNTNFTGNSTIGGTLTVQGMAAGVGTRAVRINPATGLLTYADTTVGGAGSQNLQQTLDIGSTLTSSETVQIGANTFTIRGVDASHEVNHVQEPDNIRMSRTVVATGISSNINITDSVYLKAENTSGPESRFIVYPDSVVSRLMSGGDFKIKYLNSGVGTKAVRYNPTTGLLTYADTTTGGGSGLRFGVTGEDDNTAENRAVNFHNTNTLNLDSVNAFTVSRSAIARILMNSSASGLFSPNGNNSIQTSNVVAKLSINNDANEFTLGLDSAYSTKRISYTGNIHSTFTAYSLVTKKYVDSLIAAGVGYTTLSQFVDETAWRVYYSNGSGDITPLALGASGTVLTSNGASSAPTFTTPAAGSSNVESSVTHTSGQTLVLTSATNTVYVDPSLAIDTLTITLPDLGNIPTHLDSLYIDIYFGGTQGSTSEVVGALFIDTTGGNLVFQESTPTKVYSGEHLRYKYKKGIEYWYRANNYTTREENKTLIRSTVARPFDYIVYSDTLSWDYEEGKTKTVLLEGNSVLELTNIENGSYGKLKVIQDWQGGRLIQLPGDTAIGEAWYGDPLSYQIYDFVVDEEGTVKWSIPAYYDSLATGYPADVISFFRRVEISGGQISDPLKDSIALFIATLKAYTTATGNLYTDQVEMFLAVGDTLWEDTYAIGYKGRRGTFGGNTWVWDDEGAGPTTGEAGGYFSTTVNPNDDGMDVNNFAISFYSQHDPSGDAGQGGEVTIGVKAGTTSVIVLMIELNDNAYFDPGSEQQRISVASTAGLGFWTGTRTTTTRADLYRNATSIGNTTLTNNGTLPDDDFWTNAQHNVGSMTPAAPANVKWSFLSFGKGRSAAEETAFYNAVHALQRAFDREK